MAVTSKNLRPVDRVDTVGAVLGRQLRTVTYGATLLLVVLAIYALVGAAQSRVNVLLDDYRYGRPRTHHVAAFVGHSEQSGQPTHLTAINLNRQVVILELPGGDPRAVRAISGPYLFGAEEHLTPVTLAVRDMDGDGQGDLLLSIRREQIVYLNRDGAFRLPTAEEQAHLAKQHTSR
ncbi:MAG TPA: hypothetical protein VNL77_11795 [Roseiflexaceae bacterium]|nr:hypothetical protein [Roseiflexaceae bacterium]